MTDEELVAVLRALRAELTDAVRGAGARSGTVDLDEPIGRLSRMDAMQQQKMAEAQGRRSAERIVAVDAALRRVHEGSYGQCLSCGEDIDVRRLRVHPEGTLCVVCQQRREG